MINSQCRVTKPNPALASRSAGTAPVRPTAPAGWRAVFGAASFGAASFGAASRGLSALLLLLGVSLPASGQLNDSIPREVAEVTVEQKLGEQIPQDIMLSDSLGRDTRTGHYFDGKRPVLLTLNYSDCPVLCNVQLNALVETLNSLDLRIGRDFQILTVSIDPKESTERVRQTKDSYLKMLDQQPGAASGWHFCTARESSIQRLADAVGFRYTYDRKTGEYFHPAMLAFISPDGVISRYSLDVAFPTDQTRLALIDASSGTIGSPVDQFIMWCFSYDPDRGSYVLAAWKLMRLGAATTVVVLLVTLIPFWMGRKRSAAAREDVQSPSITGQRPAELT